MSRPKITCLLNTPTSAVAMYRTVGVLPLLRDFEFVFKEKVDWRDMVNTDIFLLQRPFQPQDSEAIRIAKLCGIPVWIDYDDLDIDVPKANPRHEMFSSPSAQRYIRENLARADLVTVSTPELGKHLGAMTRGKVAVVPNARNPKWMPYDREERTPAKIIVWRGGPSHDEDLYIYADQIGKLTYAYPDYRFVFMGSPYWKALEKCNPDNTHKIGPQEMVGYFESLWNLAPRAIIVPLEDNDFNRCKSNIAWIEGIYAGAMTVAPDWKEWQNPGTVTYDPAAFTAAVETIIHMPDAMHAQQVRFAREYIHQKRSLPMINNCREQLILELLRDPCRECGSRENVHCTEIVETSISP